MTIPKTIQESIQTAKTLIENHPHHQFSPIQRQEVWQAFDKEGEIGLRAWSWLAIITAKKVLPFYREPVYPPKVTAAIKKLPAEEQESIEELGRYVNPNESIALAEKVIHAQFDRQQACNI